MSSELQTDHDPGRAVYFLIRSADAQIWNGADFEDYASGNYGTYDVPAIEQGSSGLYVGDMPAAAAGEYSAIAKDRAGGAPAESDRTIGTGTLLWSGTSLVGVGRIDGFTFEQSQRLILAAVASKLSGAATPEVTVRAADDSKDRIVASVDADGNRLSVTMDPD